MDYTTTADVFSYGDVQVPSVNQTAVMNEIVTAVSRRVDKICSMNFARRTFTNKLTSVRVTLDGVLTLYANSPTITSVSTVNLRAGNTPALLPVNIANIDIQEYGYGSKLSLYGFDYMQFRELRTFKAYMTYTGGWATLAEVPEEPLTPDVPEDPLTPDVPEDPVLPEVPDEPLSPEEPEEADVPELPEEPFIPEVPDVPLIPAVPPPPPPIDVMEENTELEPLAPGELMPVAPAPPAPIVTV